MNESHIYQETKENFLVTGGSGFIGYHLDRALDSTTIINLDLVPPPFETDSKYLGGNICSSSDVLRASSGCNAIIHLAAAHKDFGVTEKEFYDVNVGGAKNVAESATRLDIKKIIYLSTVAVYGDNYKVTNESCKPNPSHPYGLSKLEAEKIFIKWAKSHGDNSLIIIRPTVVYGPENYANMYKLITQINSWKYFKIGM